MNEKEFQTQILRLIRVYGEPAYKTERTQLIWREMSSLPADSFCRVVDFLIAECRQPPMLKEFREAVSIEREKLHAKEKKDHTKDSWEFWKGSGQATASNEEQVWVFQAIRMRIKREMPDNDWSAFMKLIETRFGRQKI